MSTAARSRSATASAARCASALRSGASTTSTRRPRRSAISAAAASAASSVASAPPRSMRAGTCPSPNQARASGQGGPTSTMRPSGHLHGEIVAGAAAAEAGDRLRRAGRRSRGASPIAGAVRLTVAVDPRRRRARAPRGSRGVAGRREHGADRMTPADALARMRARRRAAASVHDGGSSTTTILPGEDDRLAVGPRGGRGAASESRPAHASTWMAKSETRWPAPPAPWRPSSAGSPRSGSGTPSPRDEIDPVHAPEAERLGHRRRQRRGAHQQLRLALEQRLAARDASRLPQ